MTKGPQAPPSRAFFLPISQRSRLECRSHLGRSAKAEG